MSKIPSLMRIIGWSALVLVMVVAFFPPVNNYLSSQLGETLTFMIPFVCFMPVIFINLIGATVVSGMLKRRAAEQGTKVVARIIRTTYMGAEGQKHHEVPIIRFDLEVDYEGETLTASTEVKSGNFDAAKYPPGTRVSAVYDHSTGAIAMLTKDNRVVEYV